MRLEIRQKARKMLHEDLLALVDIMWGSDWPVDVGVLELARKPLYEITRPETLTLCSELLEEPQLVSQIAPIVRMLLEQNEVVVLSGRAIPQRLNDRAKENQKVATYLAAVWLPCMLATGEDGFDLALDMAERFLDRLLDKPFRKIEGSGRRGDGFLAHFFPVLSGLGAFLPDGLDGPKLARVASLLSALVPESGCAFMRATGVAIGPSWTGPISMSGA